MEKEQLLVIDDDQGLLRLLTMRLTAMGFAVTACHDANVALEEVRRQRFDLVITDLRLAEGDGLVIMEEAISDGARTRDLGGTLSTRQMGDLIRHHVDVDTAWDMARRLEICER